jgi:hypothetical protein
MLSNKGIVCPFFRKLATSCAQRWLVAASRARQAAWSDTASNHRSSCALTPTWEQEDAKCNLAKNHRIYDEIAFVRTQPSDHLGIGSLFGRLTQDVRINEISHPILGTETSSVDSVRLAG